MYGMIYIGSEIFIMRFSKEIKKLLKSTKIASFPVGLTEIKQIIQRSGWEIYSYQDAAEIIDNYRLKDMAEKNDSFATRIGDRVVIFYNNEISQLDLPYVLAHEIGHIVLGHLCDTNDIYEKERDCGYFADELLAYVPKIRSGDIGSAIFVGLATALFMSVTIILPSKDSPQDMTETTVSVISEESSYSVSEDSVVDTSVFVTKYGNKYHLAGCRYIKGKDDLLEISVEKAERGGYEPCEVCIGEIHQAPLE